MRRIFGKAPEKAPPPTLDGTSSRLTGRGDMCANTTLLLLHGCAWARSIGDDCHATEIVSIESLAYPSC